MRTLPRRVTTVLLALLLAGAGVARAQAVGEAFPVWNPEPAAAAVPPLLPAADDSTRTHTLTGLLIGAAVGAVATTVFLVGFCGDPDTACQGDEVARAIVIIGLPPAALGALIGSLVRTRR